MALGYAVRVGGWTLLPAVGTGIRAMHATKLPPSASPMKGAGIHSILHLATSRWKVSFANRAVTNQLVRGQATVDTFRARHSVAAPKMELVVP